MANYIPERNEYKIVRAHFLDHVENKDGWDVCNCKVWGPLLLETEHYYVIGSWITDSEPNGDSDSNFIYSIMKGALLEPLHVYGSDKEI